MKTNKSFAKRIKLSKNGKIRSRKLGQDHLNAKESRISQLGKKRSKRVVISKKSQDRFLTNI